MESPDDDRLIGTSTEGGSIEGANFTCLGVETAGVGFPKPGDWNEGSPLRTVEKNQLHIAERKTAAQITCYVRCRAGRSRRWFECEGLRKNGSSLDPHKSSRGNEKLAFEGKTEVAAPDTSSPFLRRTSSRLFLGNDIDVVAYSVPCTKTQLGNKQRVGG
jgi:hypothetical protein